MKKISFFILILYSHFSFANAESSILKSTLKELDPNKLGRVDSSCIQCKNNTISNDDKFCEDLFDSSCKDVKKGVFEEEISKLNSAYKKLKNEASVKIGFDSHSDLFDKKLKAAGFRTTENLTDETIDGLFWNYQGVEPKQIHFKDEAECNEISMPTNLKEYDIKAALKYYNERSAVAKNAKFFSAKFDLPNFLANEYSACRELKNYPEKYPIELNEEFIKKCNDFVAVKREAIELYRNVNSKNYDEKINTFIEKNSLPVVYKVEDPSKTLTELDSIKFNSIKSAGDAACWSLNNELKNSSKAFLHSINEELSRSDIVVNGMIKNYYTPIRKEKLGSIFEFSRQAIKSLLPTITADKTKQTQISTAYDKVQLAWLDQPSSDRFENTSQLGFRTLKNDDIEDEIQIAFSDPALSYFTDINAFYTEIQMEGNNLKKIDTVHMMPYFINKLDSNEYLVLSVLAHETGHKIGPDVSKINGHDLRAEWKDLLDCYKTNESIKMKDNQKDEVIADYLSSEVIAKYILTLPLDKRREAFKSSMEGFCIFNDAGTCQHSLMLTASHPEDILRIAGIFGANSNLRKAIGCNSDSPDFKSCGLKK